MKVPPWALLCSDQHLVAQGSWLTPAQALSWRGPSPGPTCFPGQSCQVSVAQREGIPLRKLAGALAAYLLPSPRPSPSVTLWVTDGVSDTWLAPVSP